MANARKFKRIDPNDEDEIISALSSPTLMISPEATKIIQEDLRRRGHHRLADKLGEVAGKMRPC